MHEDDKKKFGLSRDYDTDATAVDKLNQNVYEGLNRLLQECVDASKVKDDRAWLLAKGLSKFIWQNFPQ